MVKKYRNIIKGNNMNSIEYEKRFLKQYTLKLNKKTQIQLIEHLDKQKNKRQYLCNLIEKDLQNK